MSAELKGSLVLIDLSRDLLTAASVSVSSRGVAVSRVAMAPRPEHVAADASEQVGRWVRDALKEAGISVKRAVFAAHRSEVVLKVLELPSAGIQSEAEICDAVRLQMSRQLTMPIDDSVIDSVDLESRDESVKAILVGAIHRERIEWYRQVAQNAGLKLAGVRLRSGGVARLAGEVEGPVLAIASGVDTTDFVVADKGRVLFARSVELRHSVPEVSLPLLRDEPPEHETDLPQRIAIEAKRTWMSYRVSQRAEDVRSVVVLGCGTRAREVCRRCQTLLEIPSHCVDLPETVKLRPTLEEESLGTFLPLIGLGISVPDEAGALDFLNPRRPPDMGARRRQLALASVFGLIVLGGAGYLYKQDRIDTLNAIKSAKQAQLDDLAGEYRGYLQERARAEHLRRWDAIDADWIGHLSWLTDRLPDPHISLADRVNMMLAGQVKYDGQAFPGGKWSTEQRVAIDVSGNVKNRSIALELREKLLEAGLFTVVNRGPDVADRYDYELTTAYLSPKQAPAPATSGATPAPTEAAQADGGTNPPEEATP